MPVNPMIDVLEILRDHFKEMQKDKSVVSLAHVVEQFETLVKIAEGKGDK